jgi:alcohol dehydrogenase class IV
MHSANDDALLGMMETSNLAGKAINISKATTAHAWSYAITSQYNVPHGHAVWLILPNILKMHAIAAKDRVTDPRGMYHFSAIMARLVKILDICAAVDTSKAKQMLGFQAKFGATEMCRNTLGWQKNYEYSRYPGSIHRADKDKSGL